MAYQVLARRRRPQTFAEVVGQSVVTRTIQNALATGRIPHAYLFAGPRGCGKTTTARLLARALNCEKGPAPEPCNACPLCREIQAGASVDVIEIDGASNRGIDEIRTLRENVRYATARGRFKVYIIDEVHMLTEPAFNALLKTLEEPPAHVVFVLATTEPKRIPATIHSRCQRFDFKPVGREQLQAMVAKILEEEGAPYDQEALALITRYAEGSLRDALSLLDTALAYGGGNLKGADLRQLLGTSGDEVRRAFRAALVRRDAPAALGLVDGLVRDGQDLPLFCREALEECRALLIAKVAPEPQKLLDLAPAVIQDLLTQAAQVGTDETLLILRALSQAEGEMRRSPHPRVELEMAIVRVCQRPAAAALDQILEKIEMVESRLRAQGGFTPQLVGAGPTQTDFLATSAPAPAPVAAAAPPFTPPRPAVPDPPLPPLSLREPSPPPLAPSVTTAAEPGSLEEERRPAASPALAASWQKILAEVAVKKPSLSTILSGGDLVGVDGETLKIRMGEGNAFYTLQTNDKANKQLLVQVAQRHFPEVKAVEFVSGAPAAPAQRPGAIQEHPMVRAAMEIFDGEVVDMRPPREGGREGGP